MHEAKPEAALAERDRERDAAITAFKAAGGDLCAHDGVVALAHLNGSLAARCETCGARITLPEATPRADVPVSHEYTGDTVFECPACRKAGRFVVPDGTLATISTADAKMRSQIPGGLRWQGVPCRVCGTTYTVEATDTETPEATR